MVVARTAHVESPIYDQYRALVIQDAITYGDDFKTNTICRYQTEIQGLQIDRGHGAFEHDLALVGIERSVGCRLQLAKGEAHTEGRTTRIESGSVFPEVHRCVLPGSQISGVISTR